MSIIKCKMCGGDIELNEDHTLGICECCGTTVTLPKIAEEQTAALFNRGNQFRRAGEFDKALAVYENIVREDDTNAEAHWCCALCRFGIEYVEDPATLEYLPTCHRASFDSFLEDVDYLAALENADVVAKRQYKKDAIKISEVQKQILATSQNEEPFDVFICYKETDDMGQRTRDSLLAQEIYYQLTEQGWRVFYSRITLEDKTGAEYEPYIFAALNSAKVMVAVGTKPEHFNAVWVKNEWSRFLAFMRKDRSKLLLPCYKDMDPYDLPEQLSVLQSYDMSKIGFLPDLIRGVGKILGKAEPTPAPQVIVQSEDGTNADKMVKRGMLALEDRDWDAADGFFDEALNHDPECADAYLGKKLAEVKCKKLDAFVQQRIAQPREKKESLEISEKLPSELEQEIRKLEGYGDLARMETEKIRQFDRSFSSSVSAYQEALNTEAQFWLNDRHLSKSLRFEKEDQRAHKVLATIKNGLKKRQQEEQKQDTETKVRIHESYLNYCKTICEKLQNTYAKGYAEAAKAEEKAQTARDFSNAAKHFETLGNYRDSVECTNRCREKASVENRYQDTLKKMKDCNQAKQFLQTAGLFDELKDYKDAPNQAEKCRRKAEEIEEREKTATVKRKAEEKAAAKKKKKITIVVSSVLAVAIAAVLLITLLFIPMGHYTAAEEALAAGEFDKAREEFQAAGSYSDAAERAYELWYVEGKTALNKGNQRAALAAFDKANDYSDAAAQAAELRRELTQREAVSAGFVHTVGLKSNGTVVAAGNNYAGQCDVSSWTDIVAVSVGSSHTAGLKSDGTVVAVGSNDDGQCNVSSWTDIVAISAGYSCTVGLRSDGTVVAVGSKNSGHCDVSEWTDIVAISSGNGHTVGLRSDGTVLATGSNKFGQCDVENWTDIAAISAGREHTVGLRSDGTVVAVGNKYGLHDISEWTDVVAISTGNHYHSVGLRSDGTVVAVGINEDGQCNVSDWTDIVTISAGINHTAGLRSDGTVVAAGDNHDGQCDVQDWTNIGLPELK